MNCAGRLFAVTRAALRRPRRRVGQPANPEPRGVTRATGARTSADSDLTSGSDATGVTGRRQCGSPCGGPVAGHYL